MPLGFHRQKSPRPHANFAEKIFEISKFEEVFSLDSFPLYGVFARRDGRSNLRAATLPGELCDPLDWFTCY